MTTLGRRQDIERRERPITIDESVVLAVAMDEEGLYADARIRCSKGTYIRSLADTVGRTTGLFAHASALTVWKNGPYTLDQAVSWQDIMTAIDEGVTTALLPVEPAFVDYPAFFSTIARRHC
jgi:tRNA pseudouridine55 synthase